MKKVLTILLTVCLSLTVYSAFAKNGCETEETLKKALSKIKGFNLLKNYSVYLKKKKKDDPIEIVYFPVTLNRGEKYRFYCESNSAYQGKLVLNVYNSMKREFRVATTYEPSTQVERDAVEFVCNTTGVFCLGFYFKDGVEGCGVGISSFTKE